MRSIHTSAASPKTILITGSSSGIGYATALKFARAGFYTFASVKDSHSQGAVELERIKHKEKLSLVIFEIDVRNDQSVTDGVDFVIKKAKMIDVLVNNAGYGSLGPVEAFSIDEVRQQYDTNVFGVIRMANTVMPHMRRQKSGLVINISSVMGLVPMPLKGIYCSTKFALEGLSEALRIELAPLGIKVVIVEPGAIATDLDANRYYPKAVHDNMSPYSVLIDSYFKDHGEAKNKNTDNTLSNPGVVANLLYEIALKKNPKLRYRVGVGSNLYLFRKITPFPLWQYFLQDSYNWKNNPKKMNNKLKP